MNNNLIRIEKDNLSEKIENNKINEIQKTTLDNINNILDLEILEIQSEELTKNQIQEITNSTNNWFGIKLDFSDIKAHLLESDKIFIVKNNWKIIWFLSTKTLKDLEYIYWVSIDKNFQWKWIYKNINNIIPWEKFFLRTQNQNIIKSLQKSGYDVYYWQNAFAEILKNLTKNELLNFFEKLWNDTSNFEDWVFKKAYPSKMWTQENVKFIDENFYPWFDYEAWDSILVFYKK